jgi:DNA-binding transcriptional LysR family regulator
MPWNDRLRRRLKLRSLDILMAVVQAGGIGKAAGRLNMSQPAVSQAIADLEDALGVRLLDRTRRGVEPTPHGLALIKRGAAMFEELRQGVQDMDFLSDPTAGEIRIGTTGPIAAAIVVPVIDRLSRQHPRMAFDVTVDDTTALSRRLAERKIEVGLVRMTGALIEEHAVEVLFEDSLVVAAGANNPLARRRKIELAELVNEPWVLQPGDNYFGSIVADAFRARGLVLPRLTVATTSPIVRNELLPTGRFLTVVAAFSLKLPRKHRTLKALTVLPNTRHRIAIITLKNRSLSPIAQLFIGGVRAISRTLEHDPEKWKPVSEKIMLKRGARP